MRAAFIFILSMAVQACFGQDTIFFDANWQKSARTNAEFFRIEKKEGAKWARSDYYFKTKRLQMKGTYSSLTPETEEGAFEWYHANGKIKHKGRYEKGLETGEHLWYNENGNLEAKENYKSGKLDGAYEEYYPDGKLMDKSAFANGLQNGWTVYYREQGSRQSEGNFKNGNREGKWTYFDEAGKPEGTRDFEIDYEIKESKMFIRLPNDKWSLTDYSAGEQPHYIFKREEITDSLGRRIVPAIMLYIEDATSYNQDLVTFSLQKRLAFSKKAITIEKIITPSDPAFPLAYKNAMVMKAGYTEKGFDHVFYMVYLITPENKGIQLYLDMTKEITAGYEKEFDEALRSIRELK